MINNIRAEHNQRQEEIKTLIQEGANLLPKPAEERKKFRKIVKRLILKKEADECARKLIKDKITHLENRHWGLTGTKYANGFGTLLQLFGVILYATDQGQTITSISFQDDDDYGQTGLNIGLTVTSLAAGALFGTGQIIRYIAVKVLKDTFEYKELNFEEQKDLRKIIKLYEDIRSITVEAKNGKSKDEVIKEKLQLLLNAIPDIPDKYEDFPIFENKNDLISYILLSLPEDHFIRKQLKDFESSTESGTSSESSSDSDTSLSYMQEPPITTYPRSSYKNFVKMTMDKKNLEGYAQPPSIEYLQRKFQLCNEWLDIESYTNCSIPYLLIGGTKIKRNLVFCEVDYQTFKKNLHSDLSITDTDTSDDSDFVDLEAQV